MRIFFNAWRLASQTDGRTDDGIRSAKSTVIGITRLTGFVTRIFLARDIIYAIGNIALYAIARPSVRPSGSPSHGWICQKRLKLGSCNFYRRVAP